MTQPAALVQQLAEYRRGIGWMLVTTLLFVSLDSVGKSLAADYPVQQVVWGRFFFHFVFVLVLLAPRLPRALGSAGLGLQLARSVLMLLTTGMFFLAVRHMPLVDVTAVMFVGPLLVTALSVPLLKEHVGARRWIGVAIGFAGALLVVRPGPDVLQSVAILPLLAAFTNALYQITTRQVRGIDPPLTTLLWSAVVGTVATSALAPFFWSPPDALGWLLMVMMGVLGALGHLTLIKALQIAPAVVVVPFTYVSLVWAASFGYVFFGEVPDAMTLAGSAVIVASGLYVFHREQVKLEPAPEEPPPAGAALVQVPPTPGPFIEPLEPGGAEQAPDAGPGRERGS
ncbi:MAG: DMT family transporter [Gammaproteobacteria bacterium]|nr:DMT family transporter [Gammaproteobacteria bacterium]